MSQPRPNRRAPSACSWRGTAPWLANALLTGVGAVDKGPLKRRTARADDEEKVVKVREWLGFAQDEVPIVTRAFFGQEQFIRFTGAESNFAVLPLD